jgi:hypothetical protein
MRAGFTACMPQWVYDYVDQNEPMLVRMASKREAGYRNLGYHTASARECRLTAHSADPDQPFRPIAITDSGDPDHAVHYA